MFLVTVLQHKSSYMFQPTLPHHQETQSCVKATGVLVLTSTISYSRRHSRLYNFDGPNIAIYVFTILIALPTFSFEFGSKKATTTFTRIVWSLEMQLVFSSVYTVC